MMDIYQALTLFGVLALTFVTWRSTRTRQSFIASSPSQDNPKKDFYHDIEPFKADWRNTAPEKIWRLKPKYHLTMALENLAISDLLTMDNTYLDRVSLRQRIMDERPINETRACNPPCEPAVNELYTWLLATYLPNRFPETFTLNPTHTHLRNHATNTSIPVSPSSPLQALTTLSTTIDTEFLLLLPSPRSPTSSQQHTYTLQAYTICSPSGFHMPSKISLPLSEIHAPVPGYKAKLEKSMDRFFANLEVGKVVKRTNWGVSTSDTLFVGEGGMHLEGYGDGAGAAAEEEEEMSEEEIARLKDEVRVEECRFRCERQTLHRLPQSGAIVFAFKTYMYGLEEVKSEGEETVEALVRAIDGLGEGNVPGMKFYKKGVVWGDKVKEYLRS